MRGFVNSAGVEQAPSGNDTGISSDSQSQGGQEPLEKDLGGDSWDQGGGNDGERSCIGGRDCCIANAS